MAPIMLLRGIFVTELIKKDKTPLDKFRRIEAELKRGQEVIPAFSKKIVDWRSKRQEVRPYAKNPKESVPEKIHEIIKKAISYLFLERKKHIPNTVNLNGVYEQNMDECLKKLETILLIQADLLRPYGLQTELDLKLSFIDDIFCIGFEYKIPLQTFKKTRDQVKRAVEYLKTKKSDFDLLFNEKFELTEESRSYRYELKFHFQSNRLPRGQ